jgi:hypothetical protein
MAITRQISRNALILQNTDAEVAVAKTLTPYYEWTLNGQLNYPVETPLDTLHHLDAENTIHQVRVTARTSGDSTYNIKLISYDVDGLNPVTHVDGNVTFSTDKQTYLMVVTDALVEADRIIEVRVFEVAVEPTPAEDVTITMTMGSFEELMPITNGHLIQRDDDTVLPKREKLKFAGDVFEVTDDLVNDRTIVNLELNSQQQAIIDLIYPIGGYITADLTEAQLQAQMGVGFVLADGRSVVGSAYETITGKTNIPDRRGTYGRMKDNGRGLDPNGDPALGSFQADQLASHRHTSIRGDNVPLNVAGIPDTTGEQFANNSQANTSLTGGNETRPKTTIENVFIRIN